MADRGDATQGKALDGYWDELFRDASADSPPADLDIELAATVRRVRSLAAAPAVDPVFAARLWEDLMSAPTAAGEPWRRSDLVTAPLGRPESPFRATAHPPSPATGRWAFGQVATVALLVLTLLASYFAFGPPRSGRNDDGRPGNLGSGVLADDVLSRAVVGALPPQASWVGLERRTLDPGASVAVGADRGGEAGAYLFLVETGTVILQADGPVTVARAGGGAAPEPTPIAAGNDAVLGSGDQAFLPVGVTVQWRNDGATVAGLLSVAYAEDRPIDTTHVLADEYRYVPPPLPLVVTLRRLTLAPGASLPIADVPDLALLSVDAGQIEAVDPEGPGTPPSTVPIQSAAWADGTLPEGRVIRVAGEAPVVLLLVTLSPVGPIV